MPTLSSLRRLRPYYRNKQRDVALGMALVVGSAALSSVVPWLLRHALDSMRAGDPVSYIWLLAATMIAVTLLRGVGSYWKRQQLNGMSREIEYELRNDLFLALEKSDPTYYTRMRTGDLMARVTNDLSAVRQAAGPAIMYLADTLFGGAFALICLTAISPTLTASAARPMSVLPVLGVGRGPLILRRFEDVQALCSDLTSLAQE